MSSTGAASQHFVVRYRPVTEGVVAANVLRAGASGIPEASQPWHTFTAGMDTDAAREIMRRLERA